MGWSDLAIVRCNAAQTLQSRKNHFVQWGQPLGFDEEGWVKRSTLMEQGEWATHERYTTWALVPRHDPQTTNLLAHCETFKRQSLIKRGTSDVKDTISYGIASVYTPAEHRGKGYARQLLQLIHYTIARSDLLPAFPDAWGSKPELGAKDAEFSVLYSGIGDKFYASCRQGEGSSSQEGWIRQPITTRTWDIDTPAVEKLDQIGWKWLGLEETGELEANAAEGLRKRIEGESTKEGVSTFAILPTWSLLRIHALRSEVSPASKIRPDRPYGLALPVDQETGVRPFATWTFPESPTDEAVLRITYLQHPIPFEAIAAAAKRAGCTKVSMWGDRGGWDDRAPTLDSESEMPCYVVYGQASKDCVWKEPEAYTWC